MRLRGSYSAARVSGLAGLGGGGGGLFNSTKFWNDVQRAPDLPPLAPRPDDQYIFSDPIWYLSTVLNNRDWDGVARWYATKINEILGRSTRASDFWQLATMNLASYSSRPFTATDKKQLINKIRVPMMVRDLGTQVGFGYTGPGQQYLLLDIAGPEYSLGWEREPDKHTASKIMVAVGAAFMGGAALSALSAPAGAASSGISAGAGAGGTVGTGTVGAGVGTAAGSAGVVVPAGIEVVTVTATAIPTVSLATVSAGLATGALALAATAPAPLTTQPPAIEQPQPQVIEEVVTTATKVPPVPIESLLPILSTLAPIALTPQMPDVRAPEMPDVEDENSLRDKVKDQLKELAKKYGQQWLEEYLASLLAGMLGRPATPSELDYYEDWIDDGMPRKNFIVSTLSNYWPIVLLVSAAVIAALASRRSTKGR
jgi:hypothetical protein